MSVVDELLASGRLDGPETFRLLQAQFRSAISVVPVLTSYAGWSLEEREDLFQDFIAQKLTKLTDAAVAAATSDAAVGRVVQRIARNWLIDKARADTDAGSIRHTLEKVLVADPRFHRPSPTMFFWALSGSEEASTVPPSALVAAARSVIGVRQGRRGNDSRRDSLAPTADLARILEAVFTAADGAVEVGLLTHIMMERFNVVRQTELSIDDESTFTGGFAGGLEVVPPPGDGTTFDEDASIASQVLQELSVRERRILPILDDIPAIEAELGVGRSQAYQANLRLKVVLAKIAPDTDTPERFVRLLLDADGQAGSDVRTIGISVRPTAVTENHGAEGNAR